MLVVLLCWIFIQCVSGRTSKCEQGFDGFNCARENIAFQRPTKQSSNYNHEGVIHTSNLAVDGNVDTDFESDTCTHTDQDNENTYWYVDLDHEVQSKGIHMVIYLRNIQGERYKNFKILIDDVMCQEITDLATTATDPPLRNPLNITDCTTPLTGKKVTIKASTRYLTVCEVQIWECVDGYFGSCDKKCNCYNTSEVCDKTNGACRTSGCRNGTYGTDCLTECLDGTYGRNCSGTCGRCRNSESCNKTSGECSGGCEPGYRTPMCDTALVGRYGTNCTQSCGMCSNSDPCDKVNGKCPHGCLPGFWTNTCHKECENGSYGDNCTERCGNCNNSDPCDKVNGTCLLGCLPGFWTSTCHKDKKCPDRTYGRNCSGTCGQCRNPDSCNKTSGKCSGGCEPGYRTPMCDTECEVGSYGTNCTESCGMCSNSDPCDKVNGKCPHGCLPGFWENTCHKECENGSYGYNCTERCGNCNVWDPCDKVNGTCLLGCLSGFWTSTCHKECETGTYGDGCSLTCGLCKDMRCHHVDGFCLTGCQDGYTGHLCVELETGSNAGVLAGIMILLVLLAAGVTALIIWRKGLLDKDEKYPKAEENVALDMTDENCYENLPVDIRTDNLLHNIISKKEQSQFREEYKLLRYGLTSKHTEGRKPENKKRNRFLELFPYDHCRVKLEPDGQDTWDYINASFVTCYRDETVYIAAQGPKPVTVNDFWRMIWQQNVRTIVMVTRLVEKNKNKCHQYWPDEGKTMQCGQISIVSGHYKTRTDYTIRQLRVHRKDCEQRTVTQFHFTLWPDHDVPAASALVGFWKLFSAHHSHETDGPPVVHCSAGVGRTGTFIALDSLARQAEREKKVNVFMCVFKMRESRVNMVQTVEQYEFLHYALLEALKSSNTLYTGAQFEEKYGQDKGYTDKQEQELQQQFQSLIDLSMMKDEVISDGSLPENALKNRNPEILADNRSRPYLSGQNNYDNAIILPSVKRPQHYIVTQTPLPDTTVDFWRLVYDHGCRIIVCLDDSEDASALYPERNKSWQVVPFKVNTVTTDQSGSWTYLKVKLKNSKKPRDTRDLEVFKFPVEKMESGVTNTTKLLQFLEVLHSCNLGDEEKILIHCLDGCSISGVFCGVMNVVSRLKLDNTVDIFLTIRELQSHRPQFVQSYNQYKLCYDVAKEVGSSNSVYVNY